MDQKLRGMVAWIKAIRDDKVVGRGTCSSIDECYSDAELEARLKEENIKGKIESVAWARRCEKLYREMEKNTQDW